jgi:hypothetical protein
MTLIDILESKNCPVEIEDAFQREFIELTPNKGVAIFRDERMQGAGSAVVVCGVPEDLKFGGICTFTYHDVNSMQSKLADEELIRVSYNIAGVEEEKFLRVCGDEIILWRESK